MLEKPKTQDYSSTPISYTGDYSKGAGQRAIDASNAQGDAERADMRARGVKHVQSDEEGHTQQTKYNYVDPGSADYGGSPDMAAFYKNRAIQGGQANDAQQADNSTALGRSLKAAGSYRGPQANENPELLAREAASRGEQVGMLDLSRSAALGQAPSEASERTNIGFNDILGARAGAVGGARGLSALNGSQGGATVGMAGGNMAAAGGMARSKEIENAIGSYGSQAGQVRGQDLTRLGTSNQNNIFNAKLNDDWRVGNANLAAGQANLSNAYGATDLGWFGEQMSPEDKQFQYDQEMAALLAGQKGDEAGAQIARNRESREAARQTASGAAVGGMTALGTVYGGPVGGAVAGQGTSAALESTRRY